MDMIHAVKEPYDIVSSLRQPTLLHSNTNCLNDEDRVK